VRHIICAPVFLLLALSACGARAPFRCSHSDDVCPEERCTPCGWCVSDPRTCMYDADGAPVLPVLGDLSTAPDLAAAADLSPPPADLAAHPDLAAADAPAGTACTGGGQCSSGVCTNGRCADPTCADTVRNQGEADTDCGGPCPACGVGRACARGEDCSTNLCTNGRCVAPPPDLATGPDLLVLPDLVRLPGDAGAACSDLSDCVTGACCGGRCVDPQADPAHCGGCGKACPVGEVLHARWGCVKAACAPVKCEGTWGDCNKDPADGCEVDVLYDPKNCRGCGIVCPDSVNAHADCRSDCTFGSCKPGFANCDGNKANGCETPTSADPKNCGDCGMVCGGGKACVGGACV
jgi:hypothetical protein